MVAIVVELRKRISDDVVRQTDVVDDEYAAVHLSMQHDLHYLVIMGTSHLGRSVRIQVILENLYGSRRKSYVSKRLACVHGMPLLFI